MVEFREELLTGSIFDCVFCETQEQANKFVDWWDKHTSYDVSHFKEWITEEGVLYYPSSYQWTHPSYKQRGKRYTYEEALKPYEFKKGDKVWAFQKTAKGYTDEKFEPTILYYGGVCKFYDGETYICLCTTYEMAMSGMGNFFTTEDFESYTGQDKIKEEKNTMTETEKEYEKLKEQMLVLEKTIKKEKEEKKLHLEVGTNTGCLFIVYDKLNIGTIASNGACYILQTEEQRLAWEKWYKNGMITDHTSVFWRGKSYYIGENYVLTSICSIYDLEYTQVACNCIDENIKRYLNNTPILY